MTKSPDHSFAYFYFQSMVFLVSPPNMVGIPYIPQIFDFFCLKQHSHLCPLKNAFTSATQHLSLLTSAPDSMEDACPVLTSYLPRIKSNDFFFVRSGIPLWNSSLVLHSMLLPHHPSQHSPCSSSSSSMYIP